ncbi:hypothetical protein [Aestuariirhabdus haliotis]|uniref:hypothetical protein n=1 Tax=Aestuariirhabdus haliotis TaxID=2918751 RepID=UPI0020BEC9F1|nr:hypothetical protein [Aestuariirhabdus haliotis]MCL6420590.1 hypothetical protein [Aestuariirhabdus haliotis]
MGAKQKNVNDAVIEVVVPWNGKTEDRLVFFSMTLIVVLAVVLLRWLYPSQSAVYSVVPDELRQPLTALGNAAEELLLLREIEGQLPLLDGLSQRGIEPFFTRPMAGSQEISWQQNGPCYLATLQAGDSFYQIRLLIAKAGAEPAYQLNWRDSPSIEPGTEHSTEQQSACSAGEWHQLPNSNHHQKDHHEVS